MSRMDNPNTTLPSVLFREIHKNGCLKRYCSERRAGFPRKTEKVWAVFCVHDDTEAFIEFYPDHKAALSHKPEWFVSLRNALHISPSICGQAEEFEFAVTLPSQVIRLAAPSWDAMMEWVDTLRNKLRELRVLAPKENLYSKMPEPRHMLLPTRDPMSPLPLPPIGATSVMPGVENPSRLFNLPVNSAPIEQLIEPNNHNQSEPQNGISPLIIIRNETTSPNPPTAETEMSLEPDGTESPPVPCSSKSRVDRKKSKTGSANNDLRSSSILEEPNTISCLSISDQPIMSSIVVINSDSASALSTVHLEGNDGNRENVFEVGDRSVHISSASNSSNVTVIEVPPPSSPHYEHLFIPDESQMLSDSRIKLERVSSTGLIPRVPSRASREGDVRCSSKFNSPSRVRERAKATSPDSNPTGNSSGESSVHLTGAQLKTVHKKESSIVKVTPVNSVSVISVPAVGHNHQAVPPIPAAFQPTPSLGLEVRDIPLIGGHQRRRRRSSSGDAGPTHRIIGGADLIRLAAAEAPEVIADAPRLTLRETQVNQLKREMDHPGGVRLPLKKKDCSGAIALVDVANSVWVAGWKQREHPMLYNALHIGDELVSVGDVPVRTAIEAQRLLKGPTGPAIELVVKRLPRGKVLTLQRPRGGGDVGLLPDSNLACEVSVVPGGAAAQCGLSSCTPSMDGLSLTTWSVTEINGRPLNLFCKPADVTTRLNSVGRELSVLVQPSDFIRQLRKQLKMLKSYKDYLLQ